MTRIIDDSDQLEWLHNEERLELRAQCLSLLLKLFGGELTEDKVPAHDARSLYSAAHDFISHGNTDPREVVKFYLENKEAYVL
ncbi:hypothetical protein [Synechococcus phage S-N03]|uniref:Uncharacterized protein n=1 Tax=Synechococcus phage S-N03 TaxID=2718943 RepID=A0A6G8R5P4_9CAUD|nr:hypothetical protein PQC09_gp067 [Synechococcus phage S-N03]QIN96702.1 hypothetical protein [Synechococcus phage S-N03]